MTRRKVDWLNGMMYGLMTCKCWTGVHVAIFDILNKKSYGNCVSVAITKDLKYFGNFKFQKRIKCLFFFKRIPYLSFHV